MVDVQWESAEISTATMSSRYLETKSKVLHGKRPLQAICRAVRKCVLVTCRRRGMPGF